MEADILERISKLIQIISRNLRDLPKIKDLRKAKNLRT